MKKKSEQRHQAIKSLIKKNQIEDQASLVTLLEKKFNIDTNQAVISRDLRELGVIKGPKENKLIYIFPEDNIQKEIIKLSIKSIEHNETMIVVNCMAGIADFIGDYLDNNKDIGVIATIAGENVVLVFPSSIKEIEEIYIKICKTLCWEKNED